MNKASAAQQPNTSNFIPSVMLQRNCACGKHTVAGGECTECAKKKTGLQRKLAIGASNDPLEHEADRVAEQVMSTPLNSAINATPPRIQRFSGQASENSYTAPASVDRVLADSGKSLEPALQQDMGQRFGHDFSRVRVHTGSAAEQSARDVNAHAYTVGNDIVFGAGQFAPHTNQGQRLLAHELVHVIQQRGNASGFLNRKECSATRTCCPSNRCNQPDSGEEGTAAASTWWSLTVNIDIERDSFEDALRAGKLGHTHIRFSESNGKQYTYGFYPASAIPNENVRSVDGCINHPDTAHDTCTDTAVTFPLTQPQYTAGLNYAQNFCLGHHYYGLNSANVSYTCTTFAGEVARAAGKSLPNMSNAPTTVYFQSVPPIDNPNSLFENLAAANQGMGSTEAEVLSIAEIGGPNLLMRFPWQEKVRWITILLNETWITDRDVRAIENICRTGTNPSDLARIRTAVTPLLNNMNSSRQRGRVESALNGP